MSRIIAALGPSVRDKVLGGQVYMARALDVLPAELLTQVTARYNEWLTDRPSLGYKEAKPTAEDLAGMSICITPVRRDQSRISESLMVSVGGVPIEMKATGLATSEGEPEYRKVLRDWMQAPIESARLLAAAPGFKVPPPPDIDSALEAVESPPAGMKALKTDDDWKLSLLQERAKLELLQGVEYLAQAEVLAALAKAVSLNIVCEDFASQSYRTRIPAKELTSVLTVKDALKKLDESREGRDRARWFVDEDRRLLVGWVEEWRDHHGDLVPAALLEALKKRRESGAELDDMVPVLSLSLRQYSEWLSNTPEFADLTNGPNLSGSELAVWRVYDSLSPQNKAIAKSGGGLPLRVLDPASLAQTMAGALRMYEGTVIHTRLEDPQDERSRARRLMGDPAFVSRAIMRVRSEPLDSWGLLTIKQGRFQSYGSYRPGPNGPKKHCYLIELTGEADGREEQIVSRWQMMPFPSFAPEKEAELRKQAEGEPN